MLFCSLFVSNSFSVFSVCFLQGDGDQEQLKRQQELTALNLYQLQQLQYQYILRYSRLKSDIYSLGKIFSLHSNVCFLFCVSSIYLSVPVFRQQYAQALAQQKAAALSSAPLQQQQQHQQQISLILQQYQALKLRLVVLKQNVIVHLKEVHIHMYREELLPKTVSLGFFRASESLLPPVTRSLSVPDSGSVWEMQNPSSQASCTPNLQQAAQSSDYYIRCFVHFF